MNKLLHPRLALACPQATPLADTAAMERRRALPTLLYKASFTFLILVLPLLAAPSAYADDLVLEYETFSGCISCAPARRTFYDDGRVRMMSTHNSEETFCVEKRIAPEAVKALRETIRVTGLPGWPSDNTATPERLPSLDDGVFRFVVPAAEGRRAIVVYGLSSDAVSQVRDLIAELTQDLVPVDGAWKCAIPRTVADAQGRKEVRIAFSAASVTVHRNYLIANDSSYLIGRFWWPEKVAYASARGEALTRQYAALAGGDMAAALAASRRTRSHMVEFQVDGRTAQVASLTEEALRSFLATTTPLGPPDAAGLVFYQSADPEIGRIALRAADDMRSSRGRTLWLLEDAHGTPDQPEDVFRCEYLFRGARVSYQFSRRFLPQWKEIHAEVVRIVEGSN